MNGIMGYRKPEVVINGIMGYRKPEVVDEWDNGLQETRGCR